MKRKPSWPLSRILKCCYRVMFDHRSGATRVAFGSSTLMATQYSTNARFQFWFRNLRPVSSWRRTSRSVNTSIGFWRDFGERLERFIPMLGSSATDNGACLGRLPYQQPAEPDGPDLCGACNRDQR